MLVELVDKGPYKASIDGMRLQLLELQESDQKAQKFRVIKKLQEGWEDIDRVLHFHSFSYIPEVIWTELLSQHYNNPLVGHFRVNKTRELIARKYYWPNFCHDIEEYDQGCDVCLALKTVRHKPYGDLQSLLLPTHHWKNLSIDFVIGFLVSTN